MPASSLRAAVVVVTAAIAVAAGASPNILFVVADDYGYNDVGYHGSELVTPAIDALAKEGVKLENYYVLPVCTPTRSAILSSRFPFRTGLQVSTISPAKPYGLHLNYSTLADELRIRALWWLHVPKSEARPLASWSASAPDAPGPEEPAPVVAVRGHVGRGGQRLARRAAEQADVDDCRRLRGARRL